MHFWHVWAKKGEHKEKGRGREEKGRREEERKRGREEARKRGREEEREREIQGFLHKECGTRKCGNHASSAYGVHKHGHLSLGTHIYGLNCVGNPLRRRNSAWPLRPLAMAFSLTQRLSQPRIGFFLTSLLPFQHWGGLDQSSLQSRHIRVDQRIES